MKEHVLKLEVRFWKPVKSGEKNFEIRKDDRGFQVGDVLKLKAFKTYKNGKKPHYIRHEGESILKTYNPDRADTITAKVTSIITAKDFNTEMSQMLEIVESGGEIFLNPDRINYFSKIIKTGKEFFKFAGKTNDFRLPDDYVVLGIEVQND